MQYFWVYGFQGSDQDPEKLALTELPFQAVLCEANALGNGHPIFTAGDFNVSPLKIPSLALCMEQGGWVDLESAFASGKGPKPTSACKVSWTSDGTRRDFLDPLLSIVGLIKKGGVNHTFLSKLVLMLQGGMLGITGRYLHTHSACPLGRI